MTERQRPPVVLIVDEQEWSTRSLESILAPSGFPVMRSFTARNGLDRAHAHTPDIVIVDMDLPDGDGHELCRMLRADPKLGARTPILLSCPERATRQQRLDAFRAGVWDVISYPVDAEELVFRLDAYAKAKFEADRMQDSGLINLQNLHNLQYLMPQCQGAATRPSQGEPGPGEGAGPGHRPPGAPPRRGPRSCR